MKALNIRLYPTREQEILFLKHIGSLYSKDFKKMQRRDLS